MAEHCRGETSKISGKGASIIKQTTSTLIAELGAKRGHKSMINEDGISVS